MRCLFYQVKVNYGSMSDYNNFYENINLYNCYGASLVALKSDRKPQSLNGLPGVALRPHQSPLLQSEVVFSHARRVGHAVHHAAHLTLDGEGIEVGVGRRGSRREHGHVLGRLPLLIQRHSSSSSILEILEYSNKTPRDI